MNPVAAILLTSAEIITFVVAAAGLVLSIAILITPAGVGRLNARLNRTVSLETSFKGLNRQVSPESVLGVFPFVSGSIIAGSSLAIIIYLSFTPMPTFPDCLLLSIGFDCLLWLTRLSSVVGVVCGVLFMYFPEGLQRINERLNRWHDTDAVIHRMEQHVIDVDGWILKNPRASGVIGFLLSAILLTITAGGL